jgi:hypothetical protein
MELELEKLDELDLIEYKSTILKKFCINTGKLYVFELNLIVDIKKNTINYEILENDIEIKSYKTIEESIKAFKKIAGRNREIEGINLEDL